MIQFDDQRYWLYAAIDPETNEFLHVKLYPTRTSVLTEMFLRELTEKHDVEDAVFLVDSARDSKLHSTISDSDFDTKNTEIGTLSNVSFER